MSILPSSHLVVRDDRSFHLSIDPFIHPSVLSDVTSSVVSIIHHPFIHSSVLLDDHLINSVNPFIHPSSIYRSPIVHSVIDPSIVHLSIIYPSSIIYHPSSIHHSFVHPSVPTDVHLGGRVDPSVHPSFIDHIDPSIHRSCRSFQSFQTFHSVERVVPSSSIIHQFIHHSFIHSSFHPSVGPIDVLSCRPCQTYRPCRSFHPSVIPTIDPSFLSSIMHSSSNRSSIVHPSFIHLSSIHRSFIVDPSIHRVDSSIVPSCWP